LSGRIGKIIKKMNFRLAPVSIGTGAFCYGDEGNGHCAFKNGHLTSANQSKICKAYLVSIQKSSRFFNKYAIARKGRAMVL